MDIQLLLLSFFAGILTILAPCIFPLLPVLLGVSAGDKKNRLKAIRIVSSLLISILVLTLLVYGTSNALGLDQGVLRFISASIIAVVGLSITFPTLWSHVSITLGIEKSSTKMLGSASKKDGYAQDILTGAALGPVFSSCSPTYGLIIATILPQDIVQGTIYLLVYIFGLGLMFLAIALAGQKFTSKLAWATNPHGWFKRSIGALLILFAVAIFFNLDRSFEAWLLEAPFYDTLTQFELELR